MNYAVLCFSPTGGTEKVVAALTAPWGKTARDIDLTARQTDFFKIAFCPEDVVVIAVPSYGGRVPGLAAERIRQVHGNDAKAVIVAVYGNRAYEDTLVELEDLAREAGFVVVAAVAAVAEHSIQRRVAKGRPDAEDRSVLEGYGKTILQRLQNGTAGPASPIPGNRPYKKTGSGGPVPFPGENCTQCGRCAERCPAGAIDKAAVADPARCIGCMRCVADCPQQARALSTERLAAVTAMLERVCVGRKECELY